MDNFKWLVTVQWAGNLQDIPLQGYVQDYKQFEVGRIEVVIRCRTVEVSPQVASVIGWRCGGITITPFFGDK